MFGVVTANTCTKILRSYLGFRTPYIFYTSHIDWSKYNFEGFSSMCELNKLDVLSALDLQRADAIATIIKQKLLLVITHHEGSADIDIFAPYGIYNTRTKVHDNIPYRVHVSKNNDQIPSNLNLSALGSYLKTVLIIGDPLLNHVHKATHRWLQDEFKLQTSVKKTTRIT